MTFSFLWLTLGWCGPKLNHSRRLLIRLHTLLIETAKIFFSVNDINLSHSLKTKCHQFDNFVVIVDTISCHNDSLLCHCDDQIGAFCFSVLSCNCFTLGGDWKIVKDVILWKQHLICKVICTKYRNGQIIYIINIYEKNHAGFRFQWRL